QWKHTRSCSGGFRPARSHAPAQSSSALRTHLAVWRFIKHLALFDHLAQEPVIIFQTPLDLFRGADVEVEREYPVERRADPDGLSDHVVRRHDDHQVNIALVVRRAISVGAEKDDLLWAEALGDLPREAPDRRQRDVR